MIRFHLNTGFSGSARPFRLEVEGEIAVRSITGLAGPSGAGKTTLLRSLAGLERSEGRVVCGDSVWSEGQRFEVAPGERDIGFVFQDHALFPHLSVKRNIYFHPKKPQQDFVAYLMERLQITELEDSMPHELSGGQKQRVALVRALASKPQLLLLDEPFASVEQDMRKRIVELIAEVHGKYGPTVIVSSHHDAHLRTLCDRLITLQNGRVINDVQLSTPGVQNLSGIVLSANKTEDGILIQIAVGENTVTIKIPDGIKTSWSVGDRVDLRNINISG